MLLSLVFIACWTVRFTSVIRTKILIICVRLVDYVCVCVRDLFIHCLTFAICCISQSYTHTYAHFKICAPRFAAAWVSVASASNRHVFYICTMPMTTIISSFFLLRTFNENKATSGFSHAAILRKPIIHHSHLKYI